MYACYHCYLGLCYELSSNRLYRDMCLDEADKLTTEGKKKTYIIPGKIQGRKKSDFGQNEVKSQIITEGKSQVLSKGVIHCIYCNSCVL